ncbi:MAG: hypothetical protein JKY65_08085 [Planctomycetes bacterium]|nr:hypothetical protein [Planctomycetota bacterium]
MSDEAPKIRQAQLTEEEGCALLKVRFNEAGFKIQERFVFEEVGVSVELDGFDPEARVGYEYLTTEEGDRIEFTPSVVASLEGLMEKGELFLLMIDERSVDAKGLSLAAERFLAYVKSEQSS